MLAVLRKELNAFFSSLMAYVIMGFFLVLMGLWMWVFPGTNVLEGGYADLAPLFRLSPYIFMFLVPAVTMPAFAEEKKTGTLELLLTTPLTIPQLILGKYLATLVVLLLTLLLTGIYYVTVYWLGSPPGNIDTAAVLGSYLGLLLLAAAFAAVGLCASSLTERQIVAFLLSVLLCFLLYQGFDAWTALQTWKSYSLLLAQLGMRYHYDALSRGVIDSRDLLYFVSVAMLLLGATGYVLNYKK
ncbi:MAG: gliding motility-associated ABC transporter permease subunit GldF [Roseivirga sp.]